LHLHESLSLVLASADKKETFERLLRDDELGYMALLRKNKIKEKTMVAAKTVASAAMLLAMVGNAVAGDRHTNSCSNVSIHGSHDQKGIIYVGVFGLRAVGTFRIQNELDESKQPMFNINEVSCAFEEENKLKCKIMTASVWAAEGSPNTEWPNCMLDLNSEEYEMQLVNGQYLVGANEQATGWCLLPTLTIDLTSRRISKSFSFSSFGNQANSGKSESEMKLACGELPRTHVLMNCTPYAQMRQKVNATSQRICDFEGVDVTREYDIQSLTDHMRGAGIYNNPAR
jgi:hypothetical protein